MTVNEKQYRKFLRCEKRREKRRLSSDTISRYMNRGLSFSQAKSQYRNGYFYGDGEKVQFCNYRGICSYPCNGDC